MTWICTLGLMNDESAGNLHEPCMIGKMIGNPTLADQSGFQPVSKVVRQIFTATPSIKASSQAEEC